MQHEQGYFRDQILNVVNCSNIETLQYTEFSFDLKSFLGK